MNPVDDVTVRQAQVAGQSSATAAVADVAAKSVRQEGAAAKEATESADNERARISDARLAQAIEQINAKARGLSPALRFEPDANTGVVIIKVLNRETGEVIRQLPPDAVVKAAERGDTLPSLIDASA